MKILLALLAGVLALASTGTSPSMSVRPRTTGQGIASAPARLTPNPGPAWPERALKSVPFGHAPGLRPATGKRLVFRGGVRPRRSSAISGGTPPRTSATAGPKAALFSGLNQAGMVADALTPPDSTGAIGPSNYVEMDNSNISAYDRSFNQVAAIDLTTFVGAPGAGWCDPQVQWDPTAARWLIAFLLCNAQPNTNSEQFVMAWSKTSDPSNFASGWCGFVFSTNNSIFDYPKLGHNNAWMDIGVNVYNDINGLFQTAGLVWIQLPANGSTACPNSVNPGSAFNLTNGDGSTPTFTPVPVNNISNSGNGYVLSAYDPSGTGGPAGPKQKLSVFHLDSGGTLHQDGDITVNSYDSPPAAAQAGSTNVIDTLDGRLTQAVGDATTGIWTQHTVKNGGVSKVTWYELALSGGSLAKSQEGDITNGTDFVFNAAISPTYAGNGEAVIDYNRSSSSIDPVIAARTRWSTTPSGTFASDELVLATSAAADVETTSCNLMGMPCRWGDYSAATPDPVNNYVVWGTNEFNTASTTAPAWRDQNFALAAWVPPGPPTNILATAGDASACVGWTPSTVDAGTSNLSYTINVYQGVSLAKSVVVSAPSTSACVYGLTNDLAYTLTVTATNAAGTGAESSHSGVVTPTRKPTQAPAVASSARAGVPQATPSPPKPR